MTLLLLLRAPNAADEYATQKESDAATQKKSDEGNCHHDKRTG